MVNDKAKRRARRVEKRKRDSGRQRVGDAWVAGMVSIEQDTGDDCPICLFIRARADRAGPRGMIPLSVTDVAELQTLMRGR